MQKYNPNTIPPHHWENLKPFVEDIILAYRTQNPTTYNTTDALTYTTHLTYWATQIAGYPLDKTIILDRDTIAYYINTGCAHLRPNTRSTRRSLLLRIAEAALPPQHRITRLETIHEDQALKPYTPTEILDLRGWAENQPFENKRITCRALLALSLGAGLNTHDILRLKTHHITTDNLGILIQVRNNKTQRDVPVLAAWEQPLIDLLHIRKPDDWALGINRNGPGSSWMNKYISKSTPYKNIKPNVARMRNTWIFHHMRTGTPIGPLAHASGLITFRTIEKLIPYLPAEDVQQVRTSMRQATRITQ